MFLFLSKFLPQFIFPVGLVTVLLITSLLAWKSPQVARWLVIAAIFLLFIAGNKWVSHALVRSLEWKYLPEGELPQAEAIVILGGGTLPANYPRQIVEMSGAGDRVLYGAYLYRQKKAPLILLTGGSLPWSNAPSSPAAQMEQMLLFLNIPQEDILVEGQSVNTYENALLSKQILNELGIHRILLVTSAMHMPRSVLLFEKQGFEVIPAPTDFTVTRSTETRNPGDRLVDQLTEILPSVFHLEKSTLAINEYLGILAYRLRGWL